MSISVVDGIDVSSYQASVDWPMVYASGRRFAFAKAGEGLSADGKFEAHVTGAFDAGLVVGAYWFVRPEVFGESQADRLAQSMRSMTEVGVSFLPPVLDVEVFGTVGPVVTCSVVSAMLDRLATEGQPRPIIYTGPGFWSQLPEPERTDLASRADLWVAHYTSALQPIMPAGWTSWRFWQWASTVGVPGVRGRVDQNRFAGSFEELRTLACPLQD